MIAMEVRQREVRGGKLSAKERLVHFKIHGPLYKNVYSLGRNEEKHNEHRLYVWFNPCPPYQVMPVSGRARKKKSRIDACGTPSRPVPSTYVRLDSSPSPRRILHSPASGRKLARRMHLPEAAARCLLHLGSILHPGR